MTLETIFITQIASVLGFIVTLFVLYRVLVSAKDATIETLKQQISFNDQKIKELLEQEPDILLQRYQRRMEALEKELGALELEAIQSIEEKEDRIEKVEIIEEQLKNYEKSFEKGVHITRMRRQASIKTRTHLMKLYDGRCQICGLKNSSIMQICYIKPFTHGGEPTLNNMLLLCPNDHNLLDRGLIGINEDFSLIGASGCLNVAPSHNISSDSLKWHREMLLRVFA